MQNYQKFVLLKNITNFSLYNYENDYQQTSRFSITNDIVTNNIGGNDYRNYTHMKMTELEMFINSPFATNIYVDVDQLKFMEEKLYNKFLRELKNKDGRKWDKQSEDQILEIFPPKFTPIERELFKETGRTFVVAKTNLKDRLISSLSVVISLENITIYFYANGTGLFSAQATAKFSYNNMDVSEIREEVNRRIESAVKYILNNEVSELKESFSTVVEKYFTSFQEITFSSSISLTWLHKIYWFDNKQYVSLGDKFVSDLLGQEFDPNSTDVVLSFRQCKVFYGWGSSFIISEDAKSDDGQKDVSRIVRLLEISQYFSFGLFKLDNIFSARKIHLLKKEEDLNELRRKIEELDGVRSITVKFLEQFRHFFKLTTKSPKTHNSEEVLLFKKIEQQWQLNDLAKDVRNRLDLIEKELSTREQSLIAKEQGRLNKIILIFTTMTLAGVLAQVIVLSPLSDMIPPRHDITSVDLFLRSQLFIVIIITGLAFIFANYAQKINILKSVKRHSKRKQRLIIFLSSELDKYSHLKRYTPHGWKKVIIT
jgi:hypothetical protein